MDLSDLHHLPSSPDARDEFTIARLRELLEAPAQRDRLPMLIGVGAAGLLLGLAVAAALREWYEALVYLLAAGALAALVLGMRGATAKARAREQAAVAALADFPPWVLARATVAGELAESTRVKIVNFLNRSCPGWTVDLESADAAWRELKNARGAPGGCGGGCGSRCG